MDHPLKRKPLTREESDELLKQELKEFNALDPLAKEVIAGSDDDIIDLHRAATPIRDEPAPPSRQLSKSEEHQLEVSLVWEQVFGEPYEVSDLVKAAEQESLDELTGPSRAAQARERQLVSSEVEKQLRLSVHLGRLRGEPDSMSARALRYVRAHAEGDQDTMRDVVRELFTAA
jgi:hypothetical protein